MIAFFDFSRTIATGSGFRVGTGFSNREGEFDRIFRDFVSHKIKDEEFIKSALKLWQGVKVEDLPKIYQKIELNPNVPEVLKQLREMQYKLVLISHMPQKLVDLYRSLGFDYLVGNECEIKEGIFTGTILKMNPDKGVVARNLAKKLGVNLNKCIAVGDSRADIPMFESVGYDKSFSFNANEEVKKYAKHHIKDFKEIIEIIKIIN